jgi:hypothetical protein
LNKLQSLPIERAPPDLLPAILSFTRAAALAARIPCAYYANVASPIS